jgi:hypothetical protein
MLPQVITDEDQGGRSEGLSCVVRDLLHAGIAGGSPIEEREGCHVSNGVRISRHVHRFGWTRFALLRWRGPRMWRKELRGRQAP